eukprot:scaffold19380_cov32-Prasinocladus_malaysianus.AAC.4
MSRACQQMVSLKPSEHAHGPYPECGETTEAAGHIGVGMFSLKDKQVKLKIGLKDKLYALDLNILFNPTARNRSKILKPY